MAASRSSAAINRLDVPSAAGRTTNKSSAPQPKSASHLRLVMPDSDTVTSNNASADTVTADSISTVTSARRPQNSLPVPGPGFQRLEPTPELLDHLRAESQRLESASPEEIIAWGVENYAPYFTMATAFGPEGCVILAMLAKIAPETYTFNLETGYQFQETLELRDRIAEKYGIEVDLLHAGALGRRNTKRSTADRSTGRIPISAASIARSRRCSGRRP